MNAEALIQKILIYCEKYATTNIVNFDTKLVDLGFESIDYLELSAFIFETTGKWVDIAKIFNSTRISDIPSCLINPALKKPKRSVRVRLDDWPRYVYAYQLNNDHTRYVTYIIRYLCLKEHVDLAKLKIAITDTLNNHFILNSRLIRMVDEYYFEATPPQEELIFTGSRFFPQQDVTKLMVRVQSKRLVNIYIHKKGKQHYLIISCHHIALDGWSNTIIQEEIFRRYAKLHNRPPRELAEDISALKIIYTASLNEPSNPDEFRSLVKAINPCAYNKLDHLFQGNLQANYTSFVVKKEDIDQYARNKRINDFSYSVIFTFIVHKVISYRSGFDKLYMYMSFSNRHLPIARIKELAANLATGLPVFLSSKNLSARQFAAKIKETLMIYFKHMSRGAITRILLENNTFLNKYISPYTQAYWLMFTYINNTSKLVYGNDSITSNYVDWNKSKAHICIADSKQIFFCVHNMGTEFYVELYSRVQPGIHAALINDFLKLIVQDVSFHSDIFHGSKQQITVLRSLWNALQGK